MKANKAKAKINISDTQAIDMLLAKIDKEVEYAERLSRETDVAQIPSKNVSLSKEVPVFINLSNLSKDKRIVFKTKGSRNKQMLRRFREIIQNKNKQFNPSLLSLIDLNINSIANRTDPTIQKNIDGSLTLNINDSLLQTTNVPERIFLNGFIPLYIKQLLDLIGDYKCIDFNKHIEKFMIDAKLIRWRKEFMFDESDKDTLEKFMGPFNKIEDIWFRILSIGVLSLYRIKEDTLIEKASVLLLKHVETILVVELYNKY